MPHTRPLLQLLRQVAAWLLENGVDADAQDRSGQTPLHDAAERGTTLTCSCAVILLANMGRMDRCLNKPAHY